MKKVAIISSSIREGRQSHRVALFLEPYLRTKGLEVEILDLLDYNFPLFTERWAMQKSPSDKLRDFTQRLTAADAVILLSPVYNASFPASLKNVIDLYYKEWQRKPVAIVSVTSGMVPGIATVQQLGALMLKLGAIVTPALYTVINVGNEFSEDGTPADALAAQKLAKPMVDELMWIIDKTL